MINIGELRDKILIQGEEYYIDENTGIEVKGFNTKYTLRCKRKTISSKEFYQSNRATKEVTDRFICRKRDIGLDDVVVYKDKQYNITHINEIDLDFIEITAVLRG